MAALHPDRIVRSQPATSRPCQVSGSPARGQAASRG
jgi:hypothetical protein